MPIFPIELPFDSTLPLRRAAEAKGLAQAYYSAIPGFQVAVESRVLKPVSEYRGLVLCVAKHSSSATLGSLDSPFIHITLIGDGAYDGIPDVEPAQDLYDAPEDLTPFNGKPDELRDIHLAFPKGIPNKGLALSAVQDALAAERAIVPEQCIVVNDTGLATACAGLERTFLSVHGAQQAAALLEVTNGNANNWPMLLLKAKAGIEENVRKQRQRIPGLEVALVEKTSLAFTVAPVKRQEYIPTQTFAITPKLVLEETRIRTIEKQVTNSATPAIELLNYFLFWGWENRASDIHFQTEGANFQVRARIDGTMLSHEYGTFPIKTGKQIVNCLMTAPGPDVMAPNQLRPQGAKLTTKFVKSKKPGEKVAFERIANLRIECAPQATSEGELVHSAVIRIPASEAGNKTIKDLFPIPEWEEEIKKALGEKGVILVTGETGSGKSTTLSAMVGAINQPGVKIISIEKPVEIIIPRVVQYEATDEPGNKFADYLKSALRQDPDYVYVGEIRRQEEGEIAMDAAATGHGVLTTVHTNNPFATITRLTSESSMALDKLLVGSNVKLILTQTLEKRPCDSCVTMTPPTEEEKAVFSKNDIPVPAVLSRASAGGCTKCRHSGYYSRQAIPALLPVSKQIAVMIARGSDENDIEEYAKKYCGYRTMHQNALLLASKGYITFEHAAAIHE